MAELVPAEPDVLPGCGLNSEVLCGASELQTVVTVSVGQGAADKTMEKQQIIWGLGDSLVTSPKIVRENTSTF